MWDFLKNYLFNILMFLVAVLTFAFGISLIVGPVLIAVKFGWIYMSLYLLTLPLLYTLFDI